GFFGIIATEEEPSTRFALAGTCQVEVDTGSQNLESNIHFAGLLINTDKANGAFEIVLVTADGHIFIVANRHTEAGTGNYILGVLCDKGRRVVARAIGYFNDFRSTESFEIHPRDT